MSRGLGHIERAILAEIEWGRKPPGHGAHVSSSQLFFHCYPNPNPGQMDHREPTPGQRKAIVRAMHAVVRKFPQYALMGGEGQTPLWLYEPADPESKLWTELQVKFGRYAYVARDEVENVAAGKQPINALDQLRRHRSYLRGARVVVKSGRIREVDDIAALAAKARALIKENDPDAIRDGLTEIANALDAIAQAIPRADAA